jgi:hypothetical protein
LRLESTEEEIRRTWIDVPAATFGACDDGDDGSGHVTGTYYIKPNQPGLGSHICNCGYVVALFYKDVSIGMTWSDDLVTWDWPGKT